jgi:hypothetical protein
MRISGEEYHGLDQDQLQAWESNGNRVDCRLHGHQEREVAVEKAAMRDAPEALAALKQEFGRLRPALAVLVESGP